MDSANTRQKLEVAGIGLRSAVDIKWAADDDGIALMQRQYHKSSWRAELEEMNEAKQTRWDGCHMYLNVGVCRHWPCLF